MICNENWLRVDVRKKGVRPIHGNAVMSVMQLGGLIP